jgi:hypothetical protein
MYAEIHSIGASDALIAWMRRRIIQIELIYMAGLGSIFENPSSQTGESRWDCVRTDLII